MNDDTQGTFPPGVIARLLNITDRRLRQLAAEGIVPKAAHGKYPMAGCIRGYVKFLQNSSGGIDSNNPDNLPPFQKRAFYQAELEKLALEQKRGQLIPRIEVEREMAAMLKIIAEMMDTLPDLLERDCGLPAIALIRVEAALDRAREELHQRFAGDDDAISAVR